MSQEIYIIDKRNKLTKIISDLFKKEKEFKLKSVDTDKIDDMLKNIPSLIVINEDEIDENIIEVCKKIRLNEDNSITPIIVVSSNKEKAHRVEVLKECVEHYIKAPIDNEYLYFTIKNLIRLLDTNRREGWFCPVVSEPVKPYFTRLLRVLTFCLGVSKIVIFCENGVVNGVVKRGVNKWTWKLVVSVEFDIIDLW